MRTKNINIFYTFTATDVFQYEVKEDEEQNKKFLEMIELLVASGYFRARIKGLSSFDKVIFCTAYYKCTVYLSQSVLFYKTVN